MAASCRASGCATLQPNAWVCFAVAAPFNDSSWSFLTVLVNRTSTDEKGDPDLFGMWAGGGRGAVPNTTARGYDFQDTSSSLHPTIVKMVRKSDFATGADAPAYDGAYLCVRSYGGSQPLEFALHATLTPCPASYDGAGAPLQCSTRRDAPDEQRRYAGCSAAGECECTGRYAKPVPEVFPGLGYEDCSTPTVNITADQLAINGTFQLEHEAAEPGGWRQYAFLVDEGDAQVVVNVQLEDTNSTGGVDLYLKPEQPAGWGPRQYDLRPRWNAATRDSSLQVALSPDMTQWRAGVWFAGVVGADAPVNFTITFSKYECPGNCSSHGACVPAADNSTRKECACEEGFGGADCSKATRALEYGQPVNQSAVPFELLYFSLPKPTDAMLSGNVELVIQASYTAGTFTHWLEAHPSVLLGKVNGTAYPSPTSFAHKLPLDAPDKHYNLSLCPSQVRSGEWLLAVYNPLPTTPLGFSLAVHKIGRCLHSCSGHGSCNSDGVCECEASWSGGDCSVSLNASCLAGSRRGVPRPEGHGTCWQECRCDDAGKECGFAADCADFTCERGWRRKADAAQCVQDECTKDDFSQTADAVCLRNCTCPADGGACTLAKECSIRIDITGGGGRRGGVSGGTVFFWMVFALVLGGVAALGYVHWYGVPYWLPIRDRGYGAALYNEMSEHGV